MKKIIYEKSIQFLYPELAKQWHPTKNSKTPDEISPGSNYRAWWLYPYDDSKTGNHFDFEWQTTVTNRIKSPGCPFLSGRAVWAGFNDLKTCYPDLAKEWHPTKNLIQAHMVTWCSGQKVWWLYPYDDPVTGKHYDFEWEATIANRIYSPKCPFLTGRAIWPGFNDLATLYPFLAKEWHPTKNNGLSISYIAGQSNKKVGWKCSSCNYEWEERIDQRANGKICPQCARGLQRSYPEAILYYYVHKYYMDAVWSHREFGFEIDIYIPSLRIGIEYDGSYYHTSPQKEALDLKKNALCKSNGIVLYRFRESLPSLNDYSIDILLENDYTTTLVNKLKDFLTSLTNQKVDINVKRDNIDIYNSFIYKNKPQSLAMLAPHLVKEWHPTKNGHLTPDMVYPNSGKLVWWLLSYDDPKTGKHYDFEWKCRVVDRYKGRGCPFLVGKAVYTGFNDLESNNPLLAKEWHPTKNGSMRPDSITVKSNKVIWWKCSRCSYEWKCSPEKRTTCPQCRKLHFLSNYPKLASTFDEKVNEISVSSVYTDSTQNYWWKETILDPITKTEREVHWRATLQERISNPRNPILPPKKIRKLNPDSNSLGALFPDIAKEWHPTKNGSQTPHHVSAFSHQKVWWLLPYDDPKTGKHFDFEWEASVANRTRGKQACPYLSGQKIYSGFNDFASIYPDLVQQWDVKKNLPLTPTSIGFGSGKKVWWKCPHCNHEWQTAIYSRKNNRRCPSCKQ